MRSRVVYTIGVRTRRVVVIGALMPSLVHLKHVAIRSNRAVLPPCGLRHPLPGMGGGGGQAATSWQGTVGPPRPAPLFRRQPGPDVKHVQSNSVFCQRLSGIPFLFVSKKNAVHSLKFSSFDRSAGQIRQMIARCWAILAQTWPFVVHIWSTSALSWLSFG